MSLYRDYPISPEDGTIEAAVTILSNEPIEPCREAAKPAPTCQLVSQFNLPFHKIGFGSTFALGAGLRTKPFP
jgi:hypothetical protein